MNKLDRRISEDQRRLVGTQAPAAGPWWSNWDAFLKNSPLYFVSQIKTPLLIVHGAQDTAVPFAQSVEMFNNLRRLGKPEVVLLEYAGKGHTSLQNGPVNEDIDRRMMEFFDHFLKGSPAPGWWTDGLLYTAGQASAPSAEP